MKKAVVAIMVAVGLSVGVAGLRILAAAAPVPGAVAQAPPTGQSQKFSLPKFDGNLAGPEWGGHVESTTRSAGYDDPESSAMALGGPEHFMNQEIQGPSELVVSFFGREPALIDQVTLINDADDSWSPRDIEVWTSTVGPAAGFTKVATATLAAAGWKPIPTGTFGLIKYPGDMTAIAEAGVKFPAVEARFVKLRILRSQMDDNVFFFRFRKLKVMEAQAPGYTPMLTRHPEIMGPFAAPAGGAAPPALVPAPAASTCAPTPDAPPKPGHGESRKVLHVSPKGESDDPWYTPASLKKASNAAQRSSVAALGEISIIDRMTTTFVAWHRAQPYMLSDKAGTDTIVLQLPCAGTGMSPFFKQALVAWVAAGHKLIIHDADKCTPMPDYSFLPFRFTTDTPGAMGAPGKELRILEDNGMFHSRRGVPGFIDTAAWEAMPNCDGCGNELGDSNVVTTWDVNLCGHMVVKNVNNVFGFTAAYAHVGRGLVIWDGLDVDMRWTGWYDQLIIRELAQGFDPDNLPCSVRVGSFVVTTETTLLTRGVQPGQPYVYPLSLLSNLQYKGTVTLSATASPAIAGFQARFEPATVAVTSEQKTTMTLTLPAGMKPAPVAVEVKGTAADGKTSSLCLQLGPPRNGELSVVSALGPPSKTRRNIEIILDASGSMKTLMGKRSRWDTALDTLQDVLTKLPDDFNVGLRMYGHREASTSPKTCTDSELVVPIQPLDREAILSRARTYRPKGETPLVYSALQAPADLKAVGGGTVILITDGEESCKGDPVKAAAELKASGLDIRLNIVGFAVADPKVQQDLAAFSQASNGRFYAAQSGATLGDALLIAAVEKFAYAVFDAAGKQVAAGDAGGAAVELPPGDYKVVVKAGARELIAPRVKVTLGQQAVVRIALKGDQLVLE